MLSNYLIWKRRREYDDNIQFAASPDIQNQEFGKLINYIYSKCSY